MRAILVSVACDHRQRLVSADSLHRRQVNTGLHKMRDCQAFPAAFAQVESTVLPDVAKKAAKEHEDESARKGHLDHWWRLWRSRADMLDAFATLRGRFIACSRVTKRPIFVFVDTAIRPADALQTFAFDDDYSFGVLQSSIHWQWFIAKCAKLKSDFTYTPQSVFDTFPWPQAPKPAQVRAVAEAGRNIRRLREHALQNVRGGGLHEVYRVLERRVKTRSNRRTPRWTMLCAMPTASAGKTIRSPRCWHSIARYLSGSARCSP